MEQEQVTETTEPKRRGRPPKKTTEVIQKMTNGNGAAPTEYDENGALMLPGTTLTSLTLPDDTDFEHWLGYARILKATEQGLPWWIADMAAFAAKRGAEFDHQATQAFADLGYKEGTVLGYIAVGARIAPARRRKDLEFGHHKAVAYLEDKKKADELLALAATQHWSVRQVEEAVREHGAKRVKAADSSPRGEKKATATKAPKPPVAEPPPAAEEPEVAKAGAAFPVTEEQFREELLPLARRTQEACQDAIADLEQPTREHIEALNEKCSIARDLLIQVMDLLESYGAEAL